MNELKQIEELTGMNTVSCSCDKCVKMCKTATCIGTPSDILKLLAHGYRNSLFKTVWAAGLRYGIPPIEMVQLEFDPVKRQCVMLDEHGRCKLHDLGLKPTEGRLADCRVTEMPKGKFPPNWVVALMWESPSQINTVRLIDMAMEK